jgi:hypothetical protein
MKLLSSEVSVQFVAPAKAPPRGRTWVDVAELPPLHADDGRVVAADTSLLAQLRSLTSSSPLPAALRASTPSSRNDFSLALLHGWIRAFGPSEDTWALLAVAQLAESRVVAPMLGQLVRACARGRRVEGALAVLTALAAVRDVRALAELEKLAYVSPQAVGDAAQAHVKKLQAALDASDDDVRDLLVSTCGMEKPMVVGGQSFFVTLNAALEPIIVDEKGATVKSLPRAPKGEDASAAKAHWTETRALLRDTVRAERARFEAAMCTERRWKPERFVSGILEHPILRLLAQRALWSIRMPKAEARIVRVTEDFQLADANDEAFAFTRGTIGIVHPLHMTESERAHWRKTLLDYEVMPPFPQLERPFFTPTPRELDSNQLDRFQHRALSPKTPFVLEALGWERNNYGDYTRTLLRDEKKDRNLRVTLLIDRDDNELMVHSVESEVKLGKLSPIVFSELVYEVMRLPEA